MKLKKLTMLVAATLLAATLFVGCSSDDATDTTPASDSTDEASAVSTAASVEELFETIYAANPISNPRDLDSMTITLDFMLSEDDIVSYVGVASNDSGDAGMVVVIEAVEGKADSIYTALETYAATQAAFWGNYDEFADAVAAVEDGILVQSGNYIIQVFASADGDSADIEAAVQNAIG